MPDTYRLQMIVWADPDPTREQWSTCATARSPFLLPIDHPFEIPTTLRIITGTGRELKRWHHTPERNTP